MSSTVTGYTCQMCGKEFATKTSYTYHVKQKNACTKTTVIKPILKWVGGKTQILDKLFALFPREMNNYHEVFLGGGSVLLALLQQIKEGAIVLHGTIYAYDLNEPLIYVYKHIQSDYMALYNEVQILIDEFTSVPRQGVLNRSAASLEEAMVCKENYYYWTRARYNALSGEEKRNLLGSALFIFLNKTCFRGVFRVGPNGFNVPYGNYDSPEIINLYHLKSVSELIQPVVFTSCDCLTALSADNIQEGDFIYMDPPYAPENATSFVGYTDKGFPLEKHVLLFSRIEELTKENKKCMLSNADVELIHQYFDTETYSISSILCKRAINSKSPDAKAKEVIITNWKA